MTESEAPPHPESFTAWHPMLVALLEAYLPSGWQLIPELLLSRLPYGAQYMRLKKLKDPADLCLMVIADRIPQSFVDQVARLQGCLTQVGKGLWRGELAGAVLHGVETGKAAKRGSTEELLYMFSRAFLNDPRGGLPLDEEARKVYALLQNQVEQFRRIRGETAMKDYELAKISLDELLQPAVERRLQELTPEQIMAGITPEQLATMLTSDELAEKFEALPPEIKEKIRQRLH